MRKTEDACWRQLLASIQERFELGDASVFQQYGVLLFAAPSRQRRVGSRRGCVRRATMAKKRVGIQEPAAAACERRCHAFYTTRPSTRGVCDTLRRFMSYTRCVRYRCATFVSHIMLRPFLYSDVGFIRRSPSACHVCHCHGRYSALYEPAIRDERSRWRNTSRSVVRAHVERRGIVTALSMFACFQRAARQIWHAAMLFSLL